MKVLKTKPCPNCGVGEMRVTLERLGVYCGCAWCGFRELVWRPGMLVDRLYHYVTREGISLSKLPLCLRRLVEKERGKTILVE